MLYILIPLILLNRCFYLPFLFTLSLLMLGNYIPLWLFKYIFFIALFYSAINFFYRQKFGKAISLNTLKLIRHTAHLRDSIIHYPKLLLLVLIAFLYTYFIPYSTLNPYPAAFFFVTLPLLLLKKNKKQTVQEHKFLPENENCNYQNKALPLEKTTINFSGEKLFSLPGNNPHVVMIFLESFRGVNTGCLNAEIAATPYFDELSKDGILFSNFHSNGTQTFKALFHSLYGVPALYGSELEMSSKKMNHLELKGLPDLFKTKGYDLMFAQGGSNKFDFQEEFLKNHKYQKTFDHVDIRKFNPKACGTSWGVHDEYLYEFLINKIIDAKDPLFLTAATITNHHPFNSPKEFKPETKFDTKDRLYNQFLQTMLYTDTMLYNFVSKLKNLDAPIHLHIMGDHGINIDDIKVLNQSIKPEITHVPYLILPINCGDTKSLVIDDVSSHIDIAPTMMDLYNLKGVNSSIGSSLRRKRKDPKAYILNQIPHPPLYGIRTNNGLNVGIYKTPFHYIEHLFKTKAISSSDAHSQKILNLSKEKITCEALETLLKNLKNLNCLILNDCMLIHSLNLIDYPNLQRVEIENNLLIDDESLKALPETLSSLSIKGCLSLTDQALKYLSKYPLRELSLTTKQFSKEALNLFAGSLTHIERLHFDDGVNLSDEFFKNLPHKTLRSLKIKESLNITNETLHYLSLHPLDSLLLTHCGNLTDEGIAHLRHSSISCLFLENAYNLTNKSLALLNQLPLHTFSISESEQINEEGINQLNSDTLQSIYCSGCNIEERVEESFLSENNTHINFFFDQDFKLDDFKGDHFEKNT
ncbi:MAG: Phosphoglycerol transferase I [Chlamydiia bacterium]|nr:Phosphoglycerol transferase I [Chlamydiia bacterium]